MQDQEAKPVVVVEPPAIRLRRAELAIASLRLEYMEWWGRHVAEFQGQVSPQDIRKTAMEYGIAKQEVIIAEARLDQAIRDSMS